MLSVNGRYMNGQHIVGYNFIDLETGEQSSKSRSIQAEHFPLKTS
jgi:hypothetical protein